MSTEMPSLYPGGPKLRFDDGPGPCTDQLLDVLARHDVKATFCVLGVQAQKHPELVRRAYEEGHAIASHAMDHAGPRRAE
jgi:peptidoglycan/xylan/chitin deacetylase (PgdA/CDA1 family)